MTRALRFIDACFRRPVDVTPVWLMRQAGRYQSSYQTLRRGYSFIELCTIPELAAQVTVAAVEELGVDAAIVFSDILLPLSGMGAEVTFSDQGPAIGQSIRTASDVAALRVGEAARDMPYLAAAVRQIRQGLAGAVPLIGFAGAPLTLASYLIEGGNSKNFTELKRLLFSDRLTAHKLLEKITATIINALRLQIDAGCQAVQLFDSWGGVLGPDDYQEFSLPYLQRIFEAVKQEGLPRILFVTCCATLLEQMAQSGAEVLSLDWRIPLDQARARLGEKVVLQGNLDPAHLFLDELALKTRINDVLSRASSSLGFIFNLGHGVLVGTEEKKVRFLVDTVHQTSRMS